VSEARPSRLNGTSIVARKMKHARRPRAIKPFAREGSHGIEIPDLNPPICIVIEASAVSFQASDCNADGDTAEPCRFVSELVVVSESTVSSKRQHVYADQIDPSENRNVLKSVLFSSSKGRQITSDCALAGVCNLEAAGSVVGLNAVTEVLKTDRHAKVVQR
jgi:hypothetical protein